MHPLIEEFCRIPSLQACRPEFFRRMQRELREQIQPLLDEREIIVAQLEQEMRLRKLAEADLAALKEFQAKHKKPRAGNPPTNGYGDEVNV